MPLFECVNDKLLLEGLGFKILIKEHLHGKGNICKALKEGNNLKGMVDEDPDANKPMYYNKLELKNYIHNFRVYVDSKHNNRLVELCPDLENWLIHFFVSNNIELNQLNLPEDAERFKNLSKDQKDTVRQLLNDLMSSPELRKLKSYLI